MAHIGIILTTAPFQAQNGETALNIAEAALERGHRVTMFLFMGGVWNTLRRPSHPPSTEQPSVRFSSLVQGGARIVVCGTNAGMRGIAEGEYLEGVDVGGIPDLALLLTEVDRIVCL
jgi:tRNA 2-thiouridine synthesizing protein D